jgi:UDP:flavonoid glycosyltransferase YjiC (YdhE family)
MAPEEFEFPSRHRSSYHHFLGFMVDDSRNEKFNPLFENLVTSLKTQIKNGKQLIYCSFGTVAYDDLKHIKTFIEKLFAVVNGSGFILVVSGNLHDILKSYHLPGNIYIFKDVSPFRILPLTSVFITHGGFNSIKESIHSGVPMLVYPIDPRTDQNGNSARVVFHKVGLRGDLAKDSVEDVRQKILTILSDPAFKNNIENFNRIDNNYSAENFLKILTKIKQLD